MLPSTGGPSEALVCDVFEGELPRNQTLNRKLSLDVASKARVELTDLAQEMIPNWQKAALYALQAFLWTGAIWMGLCVIDSICYLDRATKIDYADMSHDILQYAILVFFFGAVTTAFLFSIGTVRSYIARKAEKGRRTITLAR